MTDTQKKTAGKIGLVAFVILVAGIIIGYVTGAFNKKYMFDWVGGNEAGDNIGGQNYAGLHIVTGDLKGINPGDYVIITSANTKLAGRRKVLRLGSDDGKYDSKSMLVVDVKWTGGEASGTVKKA